MKRIGQLIAYAYQWLNKLSLDVCIGAIAGGIMATRLMDEKPNWAYWVVLTLAVWLIYTSDHLIDGWRIKRMASQPRHIFHQKHRRQLIYSSIIILLFTAYLSWSYLAPEIFIFGSILGSLAFIYLLFVLIIPSSSKAFLFQKEAIVAFFYTIGIWGPILVINNQVSYTVYLIIGIFFLLAFLELILLSISEIEADREDGQHSLPITFGTGFSRILFFLTGLIVLSTSVLLIMLEPSPINLKASIILITMQLGLFAIFLLSGPKSRYRLPRYLGEAIFFLPALMLI